MSVHRSRLILKSVLGADVVRIVGAAQIEASVEAWAIVRNPPALIRRPLGAVVPGLPGPQRGIGTAAPSGPLSAAVLAAGPLDSRGAV